MWPGSKWSTSRRCTKPCATSGRAGQCWTGKSRRAVLGLAASTLLGVVAAPGFAQELAASHPSRPIRIIVPNPPGGTSDILARSLAKELGEMFKQKVIVENKAGGNSHIGASFVAKSAPDGYNLLLLALSVLTIGPSVVPKLSYNRRKAPRR